MEQVLSLENSASLLRVYCNVVGFGMHFCRHPFVFRVDMLASRIAVSLGQKSEPCNKPPLLHRPQSQEYADLKLAELGYSPLGYCRVLSIGSKQTSRVYQNSQ